MRGQVGTGGSKAKQTIIKNVTSSEPINLALLSALALLLLLRKYVPEQSVFQVRSSLTA